VKARLLESSEIGPEVRHFVFEALGAEGLPFVPGQFVSLTQEIAGRPVTRAYSLASAPAGNRFELCLNRVKEGLLSPHLFAMQPGDEIEMREPLGFFVPRDPFRDSLFVATGTGIAPFRSMLKSPHVTKSGRALTLLYGSRYEEGLLYRSELEELAGLRFLPTITRPTPEWHGRTGWVQQHLDEALADRTGIDVYICGLKAMVDDVRAILKARGFGRKQILFEKYD
jgi:ferredoxin-NADP reductase